MVGVDYWPGEFLFNGKSTMSFIQEEIDLCHGFTDKSLITSSGTSILKLPNLISSLSWDKIVLKHFTYRCHITFTLFYFDDTGCPPGYIEGHPHASCLACQLGFYHDPDSRFGDTCIECPSYQTTLQRASTSISQCRDIETSKKHFISLYYVTFLSYLKCVISSPQRKVEVCNSSMCSLCRVFSQIRRNLQ